MPHAPPLILLIWEEAIWWRLSFLACCSYIRLSSNVLLSTLFPNTHSLCSSLNWICKILHPHKTTEKITVTFLPLRNAQNSSGAHPVVRDSFTEVQRPGHEADKRHPSGFEIKNYSSCPSALLHSFLACAERTPALPCMVILITNTTADYEQNGQQSWNVSYTAYLDSDMNWKLSPTYAMSVVQEVHLYTNRWLIQPHSEMLERVAGQGDSLMRMSSGMWRSVAKLRAFGTIIFRVKQSFWPSGLPGTRWPSVSLLTYIILLHAVPVFFKAVTWIFCDILDSLSGLTKNYEIFGCDSISIGK
jgi:hypothetical protein